MMREQMPEPPRENRPPYGMPPPQEIKPVPSREIRQAGNRFIIEAEQLIQPIIVGKPEVYLHSNEWKEARDRAIEIFYKTVLDSSIVASKGDQGIGMIREALVYEEDSTRNPFMKEVIRGARQKHFAK